MADPNNPFPDPLIRREVFPEPGEIFGFAPAMLKNALTDGIVVIDTNVLLVPYTTGQASLEQIKRTYEKLTKEGRLRIPGQVAREFAEHRAEKLKQLYQQLSRKRDVNLKEGSYPMLESVGKYSDLQKSEAEIQVALGKYRKLIGELLETVAGWHWDDPVSAIYRDFFRGSVVIDPEFNREDLMKDLRHRYENHVPPGYKDSANEHSGIGDLLIWKTILKIGETEKKHLIFVSGEEKADWWYRSDNRPLYPRFELIDEYRRASGGMSLAIISFAELLKRFEVPEEVVEEVKQGEALSVVEQLGRQESGISLSQLMGARPRREASTEAELAVLHWLQLLHPSSLIRRNLNDFPDFVLVSEQGEQGFEVNYVRGPVSARLAGVVFVSRLESLFARRQSLRQVNLVLVLESAGDAGNTVLQLAKTGIQNTPTTVLIGVVEDHRFAPLLKLSPGDNWKDLTGEPQV